MPENKRVLIICWSFPPNPGIGGRRWAKFAKYLQIQGYEVFVLRQKPDQNRLSEQWLSGLDEQKLRVSELNQHILAKWLNSDRHLSGKINNRIARFLLKTLFNGTIYDAAIGIEGNTVATIRSLIKTHNIGKVVVSGAPFNLLYYTALALEQFPDCVSVADFRDPWIKARNYGMKDLSSERLAYECKKQNKVLETFSYISSSSPFLLNQIRETYTGSQALSTRFALLEHAYDPGDFSELSSSTPQSDADNKTEVNLVYGGAIYTGSEPYLKQLSDLLSDFNTQSEKQAKVILYSADANKFTGKYPGLDFRKPIGNGFFERLQKADVLLMIYADHNKDYKTTKYYEYMPLGKPYLYLGPPGDISESIEKEHLGYAVKSTETDLNEIFLKLRSSYQFKPELAAAHTFRNRTETLISMLESDHKG